MNKLLIALVLFAFGSLVYETVVEPVIEQADQNMSRSLNQLTQQWPSHQ